MKSSTTLFSVAAVLFLSSCVPRDIVYADAATEPGMWLVPVNHTHRYSPNIYVDGVWAANVRAYGGGGGAACCLPGRKDWSKPVLVQWSWGYEEDRVTKQITVPQEDRKALVAFPGVPQRVNKTVYDKWTREDYAADEAYLCVIFRTLDEVELAFSNRASTCSSK